MTIAKLPLIDVSRLQVGVYVVLDLGWRHHPFAFNNFTLRTEEQLAQLRSLGLTQVSYCPERSTVPPLPVPSATPPPKTTERETPIAASRTAVAPEAQTPLQRQEASLKIVEAEYLKVTSQHQQVLKHLSTDPQKARPMVEELGTSMSALVADGRELAIRLLTQRAGDNPSGHEVGVTALSLLLARDCGFSPTELRDLALAALVHDIGKAKLPTFLHEDHGRLTDFERNTYRSHVSRGVELAESLGLAHPVIRAIGEHHERYDGGGFPAALNGQQISPAGRVLAIVNRYLTLVCPLNLQLGLSPHAALQQMYGRERPHFDPVIFPRFVRMMGVYPPGTLVELTDQRMAIVISTRPGNSLAPRVQVLDQPDRDKPSLAIDIDLGKGIAVRGAMRPHQLNSLWGQRARQSARAAFFLEPVPHHNERVAA